MEHFEDFIKAHWTDVPEFIDQFEQEIIELFETGSVQIESPPGNKILLTVTCTKVI